ncbi:MAG TPA: hypothetical protein VLT90_12595 [Terriglobales bacterium]|nr:hypothetical protein [Terriglobales bacterium]
MNVGLLDQDQSPEEKAFAELSAQEREKYREFWRKSRILSALVVTPLLLAFACWVFPALWLKIPGLVAVVFLAMFAVAYVWLQKLRCPRCNAEFHGGIVGGLIPTIPSWKCYACDLSDDEVKYIAKRTN